MKLYLVRHGEASDDAPSDEKRPLTNSGALKSERTGDVLAAMGVLPNVVISSPRLRARQTAELIAEPMGIAPEIREEADFDFDVPRLQTLITAFNNPDSLMVVGHNPSMSDVASTISGAHLSLSTGSVVALDVPDSSLDTAQLLWVLTTKMVNVLRAE